MLPSNNRQKNEIVIYSSNKIDCPPCKNTIERFEKYLPMCKNVSLKIKNADDESDITGIPITEVHGQRFTGELQEDKVKEILRILGCSL